MKTFMPNLKLAGLAALFSIAVGSLEAEVVTLNSLDGTVSMSGDLLEFDGVTYRLSMLIGEISINASQVVCDGAGCPNAVAGITEFEIAGSSAVSATLLPTLIEVFALERGGDLQVSVAADGSSVYNVLEADGSTFASIAVRVDSSNGAFSSLLEGTALVAASSRQITSNEHAVFELAGLGEMNSPEQVRIVALDGVIVAVNDSNSISTLSLEQVASIFDGSITNWSQVGGRNEPISLYRSEDSSGIGSVFDSRVMASDSRSYAPNISLLANDVGVSNAVSGNVNGIGITSFSQERGIQAVSLRSVCGQLFDASEFSIKTEEYPLTQRVYFYTSNRQLPDVTTEFLDFVMTPSVQSIIANAGFVDQSLSRASLDNQGRRMAQAIVSGSGRTELLQLQDLTSNLLDAERLSFTLRLDAEGNLDARALADIDRIADMIRAGDFSSRQLLVFGFSDDIGGVNEQLNETQLLAQTARDAIVAATGRANLGNVRISPIGYGRLLPLGCNETPFGRASNNRVEIWVK